MNWLKITDIEAYLADLPSLRKKYYKWWLSIVVVTLILVLPIILLLSWAYPFPLRKVFYFPTVVICLGFLPWVVFKVICFRKDKAWLKEFQSFLNLAFRYDYFKMVKLLTGFCVIGGLIMFAISLYYSYHKLP